MSRQPCTVLHNGSDERSVVRPYRARLLLRLIFNWIRCVRNGTWSWSGGTHIPWMLGSGNDASPVDSTTRRVLTRCHHFLCDTTPRCVCYSAFSSRFPAAVAVLTATAAAAVVVAVAAAATVTAARPGYRSSRESRRRDQLTARL